MTNNIIIRPATLADHSFITSLSPRLAEVANLPWHTAEEVQKMQNNYIAEMLAATTTPHETLIAAKADERLGFIHVRAHQDAISKETCGTVPLLAVSPNAQGMGIGKLLINSAETWAKKKGFRLLHLEVFANNKQAFGFYKNSGFKEETIHMIKEI